MITAPVMTMSRHRLSVDGEGVTTLVLLAGCPLCCRWCINDYCHDNRPYPVRTPEELFELTKIDNLYFQATGGGVTFGGGEPMVYSRFIEAFADCVREKTDNHPWRISIESSLHVSEEHVKRLLSIVSEWIVDVKDADPEIYERYTSCTIDKLMHNLQLLADAGLQEKVMLRLPLIPEYNTAEDVDRSEALLRQMGFTRFDRFNYIVRKKD